MLFVMLFVFGRPSGLSKNLFQKVAHGMLVRGSVRRTPEAQNLGDLFSCRRRLIPKA